MASPRTTIAALSVPVAVAAFLRLFDITAAGFGNQYYAATVKSMTTSLAAFLYGSFDPQLYVSVDKPAPGLWPQAVVARLAGFSSGALLIPQAVCGVLSVIVLFFIVRRAHGSLAAIIASFALAVAPVAVAVDRNNTMDAELVLILLVAVGLALRSLETGPRALVAAAVLIGVGFAVKMSQAYLVVPAIALTYLATARAGARWRLLHVAAFGVATVAVSALWIAFVDLTPEDARPYVGSSADNTALELAIGHNGLERLPQELLFWRRASGPPAQPAPAQPNLPVVGQGPLGPVGEAGERGALRLFNEQLAGQISWYIPLALLGAAAALAREPRRPLVTRARSSVVLWLLWLVPAAVLFSWSGIFHRYYLVMLAPPLAALVGAGAPALTALARTERGWRAIAVAAAGLTAALHAAIVLRSGYATWIAFAVIGGALAYLVAVSLPRVIRPRASLALLAFALATFFAAPIAWASTTLVVFDAGLPYAGPELLPRAGARPPSAPIGAPVPPRSPLLDFLVAEHRGERWAAATSSLSTAASLMLRSDLAVMALGGFSGGDPILTASGLEAKVRAGEVRFVVIEDRMRPELDRWVRSRCVEVPASRLGAPLPAAPPGPAAGPAGLFDCARVRSG